MFHTDYVILVDDREKTPLPFPGTLVLMEDARSHKTRTVRLHTQRKRLTFGDYQLNFPNPSAIIERKARLSEILTNVCSAERRPYFLRELQHLKQSCLHPLLLFEGTPAELSRERIPNVSLSNDALLCELQHLLLLHNVPLLLLPGNTPAQRRAVAEQAARHLILSHHLSSGGSSAKVSAPENPH